MRLRELPDETICLIFYPEQLCSQLPSKDGTEATFCHEAAWRRMPGAHCPAGHSPGHPAPRCQPEGGRKRKRKRKKIKKRRGKK